ncbi:hypothetical protein RHRU231_770131 [Rhodococcus ruber]|uniref:Uncharacterized protein n=1 Tax=Rhodococcus ruber TaxID=1830 RepID=A0A098BS39_9NOCA|nr:hypothetical protein RHRU231_770131 [Rhodococcus ruber]
MGHIDFRSGVGAASQREIIATGLD